MTLVSDGKEDFILDHHDRYRDHCNGILGEKDWAQLWIYHEQVGIYSQEKRWGPVDEKLLRGSIRHKGSSD